jgi:hypothetical protein
MVTLFENKLKEVNNKEKQSNEDEQWVLNGKTLSDNGEKCSGGHRTDLFIEAKERAGAQQ